jgi:hypothetical protein
LYGLSFAQEKSTYLSRICEYNIENAIGLEETGNFIITFEHISYSLNNNFELNVLYHYKIRKMAQIGNNTFGLSLRRHQHSRDGDVELDTLDVLVNDKKTNAIYKETSYDVIDDNFEPVKINMSNEEDVEKYLGKSIFNGYKGWYYFNVDFQNSDEIDIKINYKTVFGDKIFNDDAIRYDSRPFWIPVSGDAEIKIVIENKKNEAFLSSIAGWEPLDTLDTENWELKKLSENTISITYAPAWYSKNKGLSIVFSDLYRSHGSPNVHYFEIVRDEEFIGRAPANGIYLSSSSFEENNIINRELGKYELIFLTKWQLRIMRNTFYALHKYRFNDNLLNQIFYEDYYEHYNEDWFNKNFSTETLSLIERKNIEIIQNLENLLE